MFDLDLLRSNFAIHSGQYDARARVLIRHVSCLLRVCPQQLEEFEGTLVEKLREGGEESEYVTGGQATVQWLIIQKLFCPVCPFYAEKNTITVFFLKVKMITYQVTKIIFLFLFLTVTVSLFI